MIKIDKRYQYGKIYKLIDNTNEDIYIGSTITSLTKRLYSHKSQYISTKRHNKCISTNIIKNNDYKIILIEQYPCYCKIELNKREQYWIDITNCINKNSAHLTETQKKINYKDSYKKAYIKDIDKKKIYNKKMYDYRKSWGYLDNCLLDISLLD